MFFFFSFSFFYRDIISPSVAHKRGIKYTRNVCWYSRNWPSRGEKFSLSWWPGLLVADLRSTHLQAQHVVNRWRYTPTHPRHPPPAACKHKCMPDKYAKWRETVCAARAHTPRITHARCIISEYRAYIPAARETGSRFHSRIKHAFPTLFVWLYLNWAACDSPKRFATHCVYILINLFIINLTFFSPWKDRSI